MSVDEHRGVAIGIQHPTIALPGNLTVDAHRADEDQPLDAFCTHRVDDGTCVVAWPAGRVRLVMPRLAVSMVLAPKPPQFTRTHPEVILDVTTDDSPLDLAEAAG